MKFIFSILTFFTKIELLIIKKRFKNFGKNIKIGYLPNLINIENIDLGDNLILGNYANLYTINFDLITKQYPNLKIGKNIYIGHHVSIHCMNDIELEDNVVLSDYIYISDVSHGFKMTDNISIMKQPWISHGKVKIGNGTFLGHGVKIMPNIILGKNCIVASGSIVTKSFEDYSLIGGSPAKLLKKYCFETKSWKKINSLGFFYE